MIITFASLEAESVSTIVDAMVYTEVSGGGEICRKGDVADRLFVVVSGQCSVTAPDGVAVASGLYERAKRAVIVISHLHVCQGLSGDDQLREAAKFHQKDYEVPRTLKEHIKNLASKFDAMQSTAVVPAIKRRRIAKGGP